MKLSNILSEILDNDSINPALNPKGFFPTRKTADKRSVVPTDQHAFVSPKFKYIIELERHPDDVLAIAYRPKFTNNFNKNPYAYKTNDPDRLKVLTTVMKKIDEYAKQNPNYSFVFYGAPDYVNNNANHLSVPDTKRFRIYKKIASDVFGPLEYKILEDDKTSAIAIISRAKLATTPNLLATVNKAMRTHF